ncbi:hypothetical protein CANINC_005036 [Pichia inconspicua]|uniref:NDT80 domain-containing protein n=1 Tax=Pichia inconspicua TaxID=52247 RepID=A0A4T0WUI4_9ASCO|nr:hypothetical protein CANINC_005036 [[Candida] inconspicua]
MSYNDPSPPTIDDEFASLFLKPMMITPSTKQNQHIQNHQNDQNLQDPDPSQSELEYLTSIDFQHQNDGINIGLSNFAKQLPNDSTISNNLFDFPEMAYLNSMQPSSISPVLANNYKSNSDLAMHFHHLQNFAHASDFKSNYTNINMNDDTIAEEGTIQFQTKRRKKGPLGPTSFLQRTNPNLLFHVANKILKLESNDSNTSDLLLNDNTIIRLEFVTRLFGRLFVSSDVLDTPSDEFIKNSTLYGYRRNSVAVSFTIKVTHSDEEDQGLCINLSSKHNNHCKKIKFELYTSLRKLDAKTDPPQTIHLDERIEFDFIKDNECVKGKRVFIRQAVHEIDTESLKNESSIDLVWDQIRFASATASNKHDAAKFNVIICKVTFLDKDDNTISTKVFESNRVVCRGRNPSFYTDRNEIMIGKIKENSHSQSFVITEKPHDDKSDKEQASESPFSTADVEKSILEEVLETPNLVQKNIVPKSHITKSTTQIPPSSSSSYTYFKVDEHYYLPPVDVGYFPHHVHHNKQVFTSVITTGKNHDGKTHKYNYYI